MKQLPPIFKVSNNIRDTNQKYFYDKGNDWESYNSGFDWFHDHVKSFMFMYLPIFAQPIPVFAYFDSNSNRIGVSVPNCSLSIGIGGGTVKVE